VDFGAGGIEVMEERGPDSGKPRKTTKYMTKYERAGGCLALAPCKSGEARRLSWSDTPVIELLRRLRSIPVYDAARPEAPCHPALRCIHCSRQEAS